MLSSAGVTSRIDRLERRGLVRRLADPNDRRGVMIELTEAGLEIVDAAVAANSVSDRQLLDRLDPARSPPSKRFCASCWVVSSCLADRGAAEDPSAILARAVPAYRIR